MKRARAITSGIISAGGSADGAAAIRVPEREIADGQGRWRWVASGEREATLGSARLCHPLRHHPAGQLHLRFRAGGQAWIARPLAVGFSLRKHFRPRGSFGELKFLSHSRGVVRTNPAVRALGKPPAVSSEWGHEQNSARGAGRSTLPKEVGDGPGNCGGQVYWSFRQAKRTKCIREASTSSAKRCTPPRPPQSRNRERRVSGEPLPESASHSTVSDASRAHDREAHAFSHGTVAVLI